MTLGKFDAHVTRVFGAGPFCEVGKPRVFTSDTRGLLAIGGDLDVPQWAGFDAQDSVYGTRWHRVGVYSEATLECRFLVPLHWPVNDLAFGVDDPVLAIGTGWFNGDDTFDGQLVVLDLDSGLAVSLLAEEREVLAVRWEGGGVLRAVLSPATEEDPPELTAITIPRAVWSSFNAGRVAVSDCHASAVEKPLEQSSSRSVSQDLAAVTGLEHRLRRKVWAVERWGGDVLASLEGVSLERWDQDGGLRFRMTTEGVGCQIVVDDEVVLTNVEPPWGPPETGYARSPSIVERIDPDSATVASRLPVNAPTVLIRDRRGWLLARNCSLDRQAPRESKLFAPASDRPESVTLGGYDLFNHFAWIRDAPDLLIVEGDPDRPTEHKWLVRLEIQPIPRWRPWRRSPSRTRLYPLEWDPARDAHIMSGPGAFVDDERGASIIHSGTIGNPRGLQVGAAFVVRRSYPDGALLWDQRQDSQAVGVTYDDGLVYVALITGELLAYHAATGAPLHKSELKVDGHPVVPLSLACFASRCVLVGTMDGRILKVTLGEYEHAGATTNPAPETQ